MKKVKKFKKSRLSQDEIQQLIAAVILLGEAANFAELAVALNLLRNAQRDFQLKIHPLVGNELTPEVLNFDTLRDKYFVGLCYYIEFALRHNEPEKAEAAKKLDFVVSQRVYQELYNAPYRQETGKIKNLLEELRSKCAAEITLFNLTSYLQALEDANNKFFMLYENRNISQAQKTKTAEILKSRAEMEQAFDMFANQLNFLAMTSSSTPMTGGGTGSGMTGGGNTTPGMGGTTPTGGTVYDSLIAVPTTYEELIEYINQTIDRSIENSNYHQSILNRENGENEEGNNTGSGDNNGGNNTNTDNTDPNQGDDNTPSANA